MVQLLTSIVSGCKFAVKNLLFKNFISVIQAIGKKDKTRIPLLCGCLRRATSFVVSKVQRPQGSGPLNWDYKGGIILIYTYKGFHSIHRTLNRMHFCLGNICEEAQHFQNVAISAQHKNCSASTVRHEPITSCAIFCTDLAVILYSPAKGQFFQFCQCFLIHLWTDCRQWLHRFIFSTLVIKEAKGDLIYLH